MQRRKAKPGALGLGFALQAAVAFGMLRSMSKPAAREPRHARQSLALFMLPALLGGCAYGQMSQVLRAQVASEADCPTVAVKRVSEYAAGYQPNQYSVHGCGIDRVYTCRGEDGLVAFGSAVTNCTYTSGGPKPAAPAPAAAPDGAEDDADLENG